MKMQKRSSFSKLLILNQYFPPDRSATAQIIKRIVGILSDRYKVRIIAGRPSYNTEDCSNYSFRMFTYTENLEIIRVGSTAFPRRKIIHRILNYGSYITLSFISSLFIKTEIILVFTDPPIIVFVAAILKIIKKVPVVYYIQDLHPDMAIAAGMISHSVFSRLWEKVHRTCLRLCDFIIVLGEDMRQRVIEKGIASNKVLVIRHGCEPSPKKDFNENKNLILKFKCGYPFTIMHAGNIGHYGAWDTVINSAKKLRRGDFGFVFIGDGVKKAELVAKARNISQISFLSFQPRSQFDHVLAAGDIHLITIRSGIEGTVVPSKLYPILSSGKPILALASKTSDVANIVERYQCGIIVDPNDSDALIQQIKKIEQSPEILLKMSKNAALAANEISQKSEIRKLIQLIEKVI